MALPNAITYTRTVRDTADPIAQDKPLHISTNVYLNDPNTNKALGWVMTHSESTPVHNHTFGHLEDAPFTGWVQYSGATEVTQAATGLTISGVFERCALGDRLFNPRSKEIFRLTADPASSDTTGAVARNFGRGATTDYLIKGDYLLKLTPAQEEGFTTGKGMTGVDVYKSFTTGIVSYPVKTTETENNERYYQRGTPFEKDLNKQWAALEDDMEADLFFGAQKEDSSTYTQNMHTTSGLYDFISTNVWTVDKTLSRFDLWDILLEWKTLNKNKEGVIMCSLYFKTMVTRWAFEKLTYFAGPGDDKENGIDGLSIDRVVTDVGTFDIVAVDLLGAHPDMAGLVFLLPMDGIEYHWLEENENHDIQYNPQHRDEVHAKEGEIWGEFGWEFFEEEKFGLIKGLEF